MPIMPKCKECDRKGGYTSDLQTGECERCLLGIKPDRGSDDSDDDSK